MIVGIIGDINNITNRLLYKKKNKKNRVLVTYEQYLIIPDDIIQHCNFYIYKMIDGKSINENICLFNTIDYIFEDNTVDITFILGKELIHNMMNNNRIDRIEYYSNHSYNNELDYLVNRYEEAEEFVSDKKLFFKSWNCIYHEEYNYLNLLERVIKNGNTRNTRNSETISFFGESVEFDLTKGFPLLTTKKMFFKGIVKELLWFLNGKTDTTILKNEGVHIWDGNTTREYLDRIGLNHYKEGCAGPIYGYQWRNFNAEYDFETMSSKEKGIDQLMFCIKEIQTNPTSRRMIISGWNPCQIDKMCLPPCHVLYQFYVEGNYLSCQMYQRSADLFLGLPFNIASTALLTTLMSRLTGYTPGKIKICIGDAHIYKTHIHNIFIQLRRIPFPFCKIEVDHFIADPEEQIKEWKSEHIHIKDYISHERLSSVMIA